MKRTFSAFVAVICFLYCWPLCAQEHEKIYVDPTVAQRAIEKHFSHMASQYLHNIPTDVTDEAILLNVANAYNDMLKQNDGFASVSGISDVCRVAFGDNETYVKGDTLELRQQTFKNKCMEFVNDLFLQPTVQQVDDNTGCPYIITKVNGSQTKIKYTLPDNSGFIRNGGSIAWRFFNPGNLRGSDLQCTTIRTSPNGNFAVFPNAETGQLALHNLLNNNPAYRDLTVTKAIYKYAPPSQNNTTGYINKLRNSGINVNSKLSDLSDSEMQKLEDMIMIIEGWKRTGTETKF